MEPKKISFSFSKLSKKTNIISHKVKQEVKKVELIECLEGQSIKVKDAVEEVKQLLVIPIKDNQKNLLDRIRDAKKRDRPLDQKKAEPEDNRPDSELTVDELAARQLISEARDRLAQRKNRDANKVSVLPLSNETPSLEGEKESTLEDYESVPISDYGLALLRGMGWKEGMTVGKDASKAVNVNPPELRPKGLGLGATKVVQSEIPTKKPVDKDGKELILVKGAYAKLIAGPQKGNYCEVQGFDEEGGRVIVKVYPKGDILNLNEFMLFPVTKDEFSKGSKILNNAKYEEYLAISEKKLEKYKIKPEPLASQPMEEHSHNSDEQAEDRTTRKKYKDVPRSSNEKDIRHKDAHIKIKPKSESSDNEYETEKKHRNHTKSKYRDRSRSRSPSRHKSKKDSKNRRRSDSSSDSEYEKEKKSNKHSKSKYRDKSQDEKSSREKHKKDKKHKSKNRRDSSSSESDSKRDKRKKNKCKSRHRRNSSSSSTDRRSHGSKK